jgi:hypothetical protein
MKAISVYQAELVGVPAGMRAWDPELVDVLDQMLETAQRFERDTIVISSYIAKALAEAIQITIIDTPRGPQETGPNSPISVPESNRRAAARGLLVQLNTGPPAVKQIPNLPYFTSNTEEPPRF